MIKLLLPGTHSPGMTESIVNTMWPGPDLCLQRPEWTWRGGRAWIDTGARTRLACTTIQVLSQHQGQNRGIRVQRTGGAENRKHLARARILASWNKVPLLCLFFVLFWGVLLFFVLFWFFWFFGFVLFCLLVYQKSSGLRCQSEKLTEILYTKSNPHPST